MFSKDKNDCLLHSEDQGVSVCFSICDVVELLNCEKLITIESDDQFLIPVETADVCFAQISLGKA